MNVDVKQPWKRLHLLSPICHQSISRLHLHWSGTSRRKRPVPSEVPIQQAETDGGVTDVGHIGSLPLCRENFSRFLGNTFSRSGMGWWGFWEEPFLILKRPGKCWVAIVCRRSLYDFPKTKSLFVTRSADGYWCCPAVPGDLQRNHLDRSTY